MVRHGLCALATALGTFKCRANVVQSEVADGIAHESDSGILEQSVYTIKMGVFKLRVHCFASAVGWDYVEVLVACCIVACHVGCDWPHD